MNEFEKIKKNILDIISNSPIPEDFSHAENTLKWLLKIYPEADISLKIAAIGHDIERAVPEKIKRENYKNYDEFKKVHAQRSAVILKKFLLNFNLSNSIIEKVFNIVKNHEHGGDFYSDILKDADSLSFLENNIKYYYQREGFENTFKKAKWTYKRLSEKAKEELKNIKHENELDIILDKIQKENYYGD